MNKLYTFIYVDTCNWTEEQIFEESKNAIERRNEYEYYEHPFKPGYIHTVKFVGLNEENEKEWLVEVFGEYEDLKEWNNNPIVETLKDRDLLLKWIGSGPTEEELKFGDITE